jgi:hypothetical protein
MTTIPCPLKVGKRIEMSSSKMTDFVANKIAPCRVVKFVELGRSVTVIDLQKSGTKGSVIDNHAEKILSAPPLP